LLLMSITSFRGTIHSAASVGTRMQLFHAYLDTQLVAGACSAMVEAGIEEAAAAPIT